MAPTNQRRALDRWARNQGYADFDTFIRTGGSIVEAIRDINHEIDMLEEARGALVYGPLTLNERKRNAAASTIGPDALAAAEADVIGEPADGDNAQVQGFDHAGD
jgi:hypothetical protein